MLARRLEGRIGGLVTGPPAFLVAGVIDVVCVLPTALRYLWRSRRAR